MAQALKRHYDLLVLKITQKTSAKRRFSRRGESSFSSGFVQTKAHFTLETKENGQLTEVLDLGSFDIRDLGIVDDLNSRNLRRRDGDFLVPPEVLAELEGWIGANSQPDKPLWLHLEKPYGFLGVVPWERLMQERLNVPMLRLPDFFQSAPAELPSTLDVLLCGSSPVAKGSIDLEYQVERIIRQILEAVLPSRITCRIHVFRRFQGTRLFITLRAIWCVFGDIIRY